MAEYGVKSVVLKTGINAHTLRVWERRYQVVTPRRTETDRRVYSEEDVAKLTWIALLVAAGHSISKLARWSVDELRKAAEETRIEKPKNKPLDREIHPAELFLQEQALQKIIAGLDRFRLREVSEILTHTRMQTNIRDFVFNVALPLLVRTGTLVAEDKLSIAHEHALSAILKTHIYQILFGHLAEDSRSKARPVTVTIATQEGDYHEFGILLAALLLASRRIPFHFFGANMPASSLAHAANAVRSSIVLLGRTYPGKIMVQGLELKQRDYLKELDQGLTQNTVIWVGGHLDPDCTRLKLRHDWRRFGSLYDFEKELDSLPMA